MKKIEVLKGVAKFAVSVGVGAIVSNAVSFTTPMMGMGLLKKAAIGLGSFVLGAMLSEKTCDYVDQKIEQALDEVRKIATET